MRFWLPAGVLIAWCMVSLFSAWLPIHPQQVTLERILAGPGVEGLLGYDEIGRPLLDRLLAGARTSFLVSVSVTIVSLGVGTCIGVLSGWCGGTVDHVVVRLIDVFLAFPGILLAIALAGILGPGIDNVVIALSVVGWVGFARLARAQTLSIKHREHVQAAVALGSPAGRILLVHLLPLIAAPLIVEATFGVAAVIVAEAGLSFLGLGVQPPSPSWGSIMREGARYMLVAPHLVVAPAMVLLVVVLSVNILGDWLRDRLDIRVRNGT